MTEEKIDLSCLDPARDPARWERRIAAVTAEALAERAHGASPARSEASTPGHAPGSEPLPEPAAAPDWAGGALRWLRPAAALAAALAVVIWALALAGVGRAPATRRAQGSAPAGSVRTAGPEGTQASAQPARTARAAHSSTAGARDRALTLSRWAMQGARPAPEEVLAVLGGSHDHP